MSRARGILTPLIVTAIGVGTGNITLFLFPFGNGQLTSFQASRYLTQRSSKTRSRRSLSSTSYPNLSHKVFCCVQTRLSSHRNVKIKDQHAPSPSPEEQIRKTEEAVANAGGATGISNDAERWAKVQSGQFSKPTDTFRWSDVPLDRYSTPEKPS